MREAASLTSSDRQQQLPASLMQRLAMMQHLALLAKAQTEGKAPNALTVQHRPRSRAQAIVLAWFSLGVLTSGAAGVGTLMGLRALEARGTPVTWDMLGRTIGTAWAAAWAKVPAIASAPWRAESPDSGWSRVRVAIDRRTRAHAPLALQVTGADDLPISVVLDGVPAGVRLSRGMPVGPSTWVLGRADLEDLHLALDATAPDAFELRIGIAAPTGVATTGSIVQVHVVDGSARAQAAADRGYRDRTAVASQPARAAPSAPAPSIAGTGLTGSDHKRTTVAATGSTTQAPAETAARSWPEGASGLGAVPRESKPAWWSAPAPSWSPFQDGSQRR